MEPPRAALSPVSEKNNTAGTYRHPVGLFSFGKKFIACIGLLSFLPMFLGLVFLASRFRAIMASVVGNLIVEDVRMVEEGIRLGGQRLEFEVLVLVGIFTAIISVGVVVVYGLFVSPLRRLIGWIGRVRDGTDAGTSPLLFASRRDEIGVLAQEIEGIVRLARETEDRAVALTKTKNEFISIVAHQLRTSLTGMRWALDDIRRAAGTEQDRTHKIQIAFDATMRLIGIVNDILDVVRMEEGKFGYQFKESDVWEMIETTSQELNALAKERGVHVELVQVTNPLPRIFIDSGRVSLALSNLISNGIQYTPKGGSVTVTARADSAENQLEVAVRDTGIGIPRAAMAKLFAKFFRSPSAIQMQPNGSGLGLFIAKNIIEGHGGRLWAESEERKGSTFHIALPLHRSGLPAGAAQPKPPLFGGGAVSWERGADHESRIPLS